MKVISDISIKNFEFWSGAKDTASELTDEQFDMVEEALEELHPDGITDTELNDTFWFERDWIYEVAGIYPKCYKVIAKCGLAGYVKVRNEEDMDILTSSCSNIEEIEEWEADEFMLIDKDELKDFCNTHFFEVYSKIKHNRKVIRCTGDGEAEELKEQFKYASKIEEIVTIPEDGIEDAEEWEDYDSDSGAIEEFVYDEEDMYDKYNIPAWAVKEVCKLVLGKNGEFDYYEVPESNALDMYFVELTDEEAKSVSDFVKQLNDAMPNGFIIDWDDFECGSPCFTNSPKFGEATDCVTFRVYEK